MTADRPSAQDPSDRGSARARRHTRHGNRGSDTGGDCGAPLVILGAGLAGLSLACALLEEGVSAPIVLIDRRTTWERDRTWCTWESEATRFSHLASHRWPAWRVVADGHEAVTRSTRLPYLHFDSRDVYRHALGVLDRAPNVELRTGQTIVSVQGRGATQRPTVLTGDGRVQASVVFDALGPNSPLLSEQPPGDIELAQRFLGWEVETDAPVFDPGVATLMDFRSGEHDGLRFFYVLPFSPTRALIEDTSIGRRGLDPAKRRLAIEAELRERWGVNEWKVIHEERGHVAMNNRAYPVHRGPHIHAVGAGAGAVRPSSGYAFTRIQRHCTRLARAVAQGQRPPDRLAPARLTLLDAIFLRALAAEPERFPEIFLRMADRVPGDTFARFMTDASTPADEAMIVALLPKSPFLRSALSSARPGRGRRAEAGARVEAGA